MSLNIGNELTVIVIYILTYSFSASGVFLQNLEWMGYINESCVVVVVVVHGGGGGGVCVCYTL